MTADLSQLSGCTKLSLLSKVIKEEQKVLQLSLREFTKSTTVKAWVVNINQFAWRNIVSLPDWLKRKGCGACEMATVKV